MDLAIREEADDTMDTSARRHALDARLTAEGVDLLWCPIPGGDAEYLTGYPRRNASFGVYEHSHQWASGVVLRPGGAGPVFVVPRGFSAFNPPGIEGELVSIDYRDDAAAVLRGVLERGGAPARIGVAGRTWSTTTLAMLDLFPGVEAIDCTDVMQRLRWRKSAEEIAAMERASRIADEAMREVVARVAPGVTELTSPQRSTSSSAGWERAPRRSTRGCSRWG
ncbi:MAG: hypothetical protein FJW96_09430 [Actinobacteria bacterium]|nr:hypothetical protein [Actinomycetota bacterium]